MFLSTTGNYEHGGENEAATQLYTSGDDERNVVVSGNVIQKSWKHQTICMNFRHVDQFEYKKCNWWSAHSVILYQPVTLPWWQHSIVLKIPANGLASRVPIPMNIIIRACDLTAFSIERISIGMVDWTPRNIPINNHHWTVKNVRRLLVGLLIYVLICLFSTGLVTEKVYVMIDDWDYTLHVLTIHEAEHHWMKQHPWKGDTKDESYFN